MNTPRKTAPLLLAGLLIGAGGCASGGGTAGSTSPAAQSTSPGAPMESSSAMMPSATGTGISETPTGAHTIAIKNYSFGNPVTVSPGAKVTVTNADTPEHTVTADQGPAFDVEIKGNGGTATFTAPSKPGTYTFHCRYHPNMHGMLTVK